LSLPTILLLCAAGVEVVGLAFAAGGYIATMSSKSEMEEAWPDAKTWGCREAPGYCGRREEAFASADTANTVGALGFSIAVALGSSLAFAGALAWRLEPETPAAPKTGMRVQVTPGPGGIVIHGTF
jgi:hypothetical protein